MMMMMIMILPENVCQSIIIYQCNMFDKFAVTNSTYTSTWQKIVRLEWQQHWKSFEWWTFVFYLFDIANLMIHCYVKNRIFIAWWKMCKLLFTSFPFDIRLHLFICNSNVTTKLFFQIIQTHWLLTSFFFFWS